MTDTRITDFEAVAPMPIYTQADLDAAVQKERKLCIGDCHGLAIHLRCFQDKQGGAIADACAAAIEERGQKGCTHD